VKKDLTAVSIKLLFDGMVTPHDIYNADGNVLLIRQDNTLKISQIEAIRRMNAGRDIILVTPETRRMLLRRSISCELVSQAELEEETGYTEIKDDMLALIEEIAHTKNVPQDTLYTVSEALSNRLEVTSPGKILDLINALAPADEYLQRHCANVSLLNGLIGKWLGFPKETVDMLVLIGLVHDTGKALVPPQILNAPRKLALAEFEVMKSHPVYGYDSLADFPASVRYGARGHHEKYDGNGYPDRTRGSDIPLEARITAVSDIYDAMVSRRAYKEPRSPFHIITWLSKLRETELDPLVVDTFIENMPNELVDKPVMLSNGEIGAIHAVDPYDLEFPDIRMNGKVIKSSERLFCTFMFFEEKES